MRETERHILWVDGVGAWLLFIGDRVSLGGPPDTGGGADLELLANLSRRHATLTRSGEGYLLQAHSFAKVDERPVLDRMALRNGSEIQLGERVKLQFRLPTILSGTAVLEFVSDHRPLWSVDGAILLHENCLLGPSADHHITTPLNERPVILFRRDGEFYARPAVNGAHGERLVPIGEPVTVDEFTFRLEPLPAEQSPGFARSRPVGT